MSKKGLSYVFNKELPVIKEGWKGNIVLNGQFSNDGVPVYPPLWSVLKWKLGRNPQKKEKAQDTFKLSVFPQGELSTEKDKIIWLGHASFILVVNGVTLLTDPVFFDIPTIKRKCPLPFSLEKLQPIDYLLVSHDHRDHLDKKSLEVIAKQNPDVEALLPLETGRHFDSDLLKGIKKQEAGWYQEYKIDKDIRIIFLPTHHWCKRGIFDFNQTLWGSFLIIHGDKKIFFAGDSAYSSVFRGIRQEFGEMDICILPIGAYAPQFMMKDAHMTPEEAVQVFQDLGGKTLIPMHYGTFDLSDEPVGEPIRRLDKRFRQVADNQVLVKLDVGKDYWL